MLNSLTDSDEASASLRLEGYSVLLRLLAPITPHICHHLWIKLGFGEDILKSSWPMVDEKALKSSEIVYVVQINGKRRGEITAHPKTVDSELLKLIEKTPHIQKHLSDKVFKKSIILPKRKTD